MKMEMQSDEEETFNIAGMLATSCSPWERNGGERRNTGIRKQEKWRNQEERECGGEDDSVEERESVANHIRVKGQCVVLEPSFNSASPTIGRTLFFYFIYIYS